MTGQEYTGLAVDRHVAASTQNQALGAVLFLYRAVIGVEMPCLDDLVRARRPERLPVALTRDEVRLGLDGLAGAPRLMAYLLYGAGLRLRECCRLRVQDVDFATNQVVVRSGKGDNDRVTMLPAVVKSELGPHLDGARAHHRRDLERGAGWVELPDALARNYPNAGREWHGSACSPQRGCTSIRSPASAGVTPSTRRCCSAPSRRRCSGPVSRSAPARKRFATPLRPTCSSPATNIRTVPQLLGHRDVSTTMIYTHVLNRGPAGVRSPVDAMFGGWGREDTRGDRGK